jgi:hypothetical protein
MNANDHAEHDNDEVALKKARLQKVENAIKHEQASLANLISIRDAIRAELKMCPCLCHTRGAKGNFHCFGPCCGEENVRK